MHPAFEDLFKNIPGMEGAVAQQGQALQAQMFSFLQKKVAGKTRFRTINSADIEGLVGFLQKNTDQIIHWNIITNPQTGSFVLVVEEVME